MKLDSFKHLLIEELRDVYDAEIQLVKALPLLAESGVLPELKTAFAEHLARTTDHVDRLESIFEFLDETPHGNPCKTMSGLVTECQDLIDEASDADPGVLDVALIGATQKIEHWEIAAYGCARTYAQILGLDQVAQLLQQTLEEESETNRVLNQIAMQSVNPEAADATSEEKTLRQAVFSVLETAC